MFKLPNDRLQDFIHYRNQFNGRKHKLADKRIHRLSFSDLSYLLREGTFVDISLEISFLKLQRVNNFELDSWDYDTKSDLQREILREIVLHNKKYRDLYPRIFSLIQQIIEDRAYTLHLPEEFTSDFLNWKFEKLTWSKSDTANYVIFLEHNAGSTVLSAFAKVGRYKRAIMQGNSFTFETDKGPILIDSPESFINEFANHLMWSDKVLEYIEEEISTLSDDSILAKFM